MSQSLDRGKLGLTVPDAFVRGIRHIGYRSNVEAIAEIIDNSIQALSERIDVVFGYDADHSVKKPARIAIIDSGHGMAPAMMRLAMMWGGTHRENDRNGLGRYGYGLPCAAVSVGRRFAIYSKVQGAPVYRVTLDLDDLDSGKYRDLDGDTVVPGAVACELPPFLQAQLGAIYPGGWQSGTIVTLEKLDRLDWTTTLGLKVNLGRHFGVTYHKLLEATPVYVDGQRVEPIDPLFLTPGQQLYDIDDDRAQPLDTVRVPIALGEGRQGSITLRYAWLPPTFGSIDKGRDAVGLNANQRFAVIKAYHGIIFSRNARVIDVQTRMPWTAFINNDRYIRVEVEFSATLDEMFGMTTSKQQITVTSEMWDALRGAGLQKAIEHLRAKVRQAKLERKVRDGTAIDKISAGRAEQRRKEPFPRTDPPAEAGEDANCQQLSRALGRLLALIEDRMAVAPQAIAADYQNLLKLWRQQPQSTARRTRAGR